MFAFSDFLSVNLFSVMGHKAHASKYFESACEINRRQENIYKMLWEAIFFSSILVMSVQVSIMEGKDSSSK